jgi:hypothetical protein
VSGYLTHTKKSFVDEPVKRGVELGTVNEGSSVVHTEAITLGALARALSRAVLSLGTKEKVSQQKPK